MSFQATQILPGIYLGDRKDASNLKGLQSKGITHILNVAHDVKNYFPNEFDYLRLDVKDRGRDPGISRVFQTALDFVMDNPTNNVLIHCRYGMNRSATIAVLIVQYEMNMSFKEAKKHVASLRRIKIRADNLREIRNYSLITMTGSQS